MQSIHLAVKSLKYDEEVIGSIINEIKDLGVAARALVRELIKAHEDILMWGHNTNKHSGLRITFDTSYMGFEENLLKHGW